MSSAIKVAGPLLLAFWLGAGLVACAPQVAEAPFPRRPDTVEPGDLLGPFDGQVVDAATGKPIPDATVYAAWGYSVGRDLSAPAGGASESVQTDSDGRYHLPRLSDVPSGRFRIARVAIVIYKSGFIAWRSDRRFEDLSVRHDFSQTENLAKLDRFAPGLSHARHVRFVGGSGALKRALAGEVVEASLELSAGPAGQAAEAGPPLDASVLLSIDELKAVTGYAGTFTLERLTDLPSTATYGSHHFRAVGKPESFDAAIRVWKLKTEDQADRRYDSLLREVPNAESLDQVSGHPGDRALRGHDGKILAAATEDRGRHLVLELTCGVDLCRDLDQAEALLRRILARADRLDHPEAARPASGTEPSPEKPTEETKTPPAEDNQFQLTPPELKRR
ncbi:MAG TPA: carboxypeptidase-like regulatory domain-containing protein [Polyangia bacterium]|jgi:hypothetical protein